MQLNSNKCGNLKDEDYLFMDEFDGTQLNEPIAQVSIRLDETGTRYVEYVSKSHRTIGEVLSDGRIVLAWYGNDGLMNTKILDSFSKFLDYIMSFQK